MEGPVTSIHIGSGATFGLTTTSTAGAETYEVSALTGSGGHFTVSRNNKTLQVNIADAETTSDFGGRFNDTSANNDFSVIKAGAGTLILSGTAANIHGGLTTVADGTLALDKTAGVDAIATGGVQVNSGATLRLDASNQINNGSALVLNGGTFDLQTFSETLDTLDLTSNSAITLGGVGGTDRLVFADSSALDWEEFILTIHGQIGADSLRFGTDATGLTEHQLGLIIFADYGGVTAQINSLGYIQAIPEPSTMMLLGLGLVALCWRGRRLFISRN